MPRYAPVEEVAPMVGAHTVTKRGIMNCKHGLDAPTCASCKYGPAADDTYNGPPPDIDYAWQARNHAVTERRNAKGATVRKVTRFGAATVIGALDADVHGRPLLAELGPDLHHLAPSSAAARLLVRAELRRKRHGFSTIDIDAITREAYGDLIPPVVGSTDVRQYEQVIHRDRSAMGTAQVTARAVGLDGGRSHHFDTLWIQGYVSPSGLPTGRVVRDDTIGSICEQSDAYAPQTATTATWPTRGTYGVTVEGRLPLERRAGEAHTLTLEWRPVMAGDARLNLSPYGALYRVARPVVAHADSEHIWHGHNLIDRSAPVVKTADQLAQRTTITADTEQLPTTRDAWANLIGRLAPGERADLGHITITLGKRGDRYSAVVRGEHPTRYQTRTAEGLALKLSA